MQPKIKAPVLVPHGVLRKPAQRGRDDGGFLRRAYLRLDCTLNPVLRGIGVGGQSILPKSNRGAQRVLPTPAASVRQ